MTVITPKISSSIYDNPLSNKQIGRIQFFYEATVSNVNTNDTIRIDASFTDNDTGNFITGTAKVDSREISPFTDLINGGFITQFEILQGDKFPSSIGITLTFKDGKNRPVGQIQSSVLFTGTQTDLPLPTLDLVNTFFDFDRTFKLENGVLAGTIKAVKSPTWKDVFNNTQLSLNMQTKDSKGIVIDIQFFPFTFGTQQEFSQDISVLNITSPDVTVQLFVFDVLQQPFSAVNAHTFIEEGTTPPPSPPPPSPCTTGFHEEIIGGAAVCVADDQNNPPIDSKFCEQCQIHVFFFDTCPICAEPPPPPPPPPPPEPSNVCFTLLYRDLTEVNYSLTSTEFDDLIANPVSTGICSPVVKNISDCDTQSSELGVVRSDIFNKVAECLAEPPENDVKLGMVIQSPTGFRIENNRLIGQISYVATETFNPFWYGKDLVSITQIKDRFGAVIQIKENRLNFTETERDELINIDSSASDQDVLIVEFFVIVSLQDPRRFSDAIQLTVTAQGQGDTTPNGGGLKFGSGGVITKLTGGFFGLLALCLLTQKGRK